MFELRPPSGAFLLFVYLCGISIPSAGSFSFKTAANAKTSLICIFIYSFNTCCMLGTQIGSKDQRKAWSLTSGSSQSGKMNKNVKEGICVLNAIEISVGSPCWVMGTITQARVSGKDPLVGS